MAQVPMAAATRTRNGAKECQGTQFSSFDSSRHAFSGATGSPKEFFTFVEIARNLTFKSLFLSFSR